MDHVNFALPLQEFEPGEDMYPERHYYAMVDAKYVKHGSIIDNPDLNALPKMSDQEKLLDIPHLRIHITIHDNITIIPFAT